MKIFHGERPLSETVSTRNLCTVIYTKICTHIYILFQILHTYTHTYIHTCRHTDNNISYMAVAEFGRSYTLLYAFGL